MRHNDRAPMTIAHTPPGKEAQLDADIRLLGRVLGEVVAEQAGAEVFELVERRPPARRGRVPRRRRRRRAGRAARRPRLEQALHVIRAFSYFSLLANIAEDVHPSGAGGPTAWPDRARSRAASPPGSTASPPPGVDARRPSTRCSRRLEVSPVLTAHPTEVRPQDRARHARATIADLLVQRDRTAAERRRAGASGRAPCASRC